VNPTPRTYTFRELNESIPTESRTSSEKLRGVFVNGGNLTISNPSDSQIKDGLVQTIEANQDLFARLDLQDECIQTVLNPDDLTGTIEYVRKGRIYTAIDTDEHQMWYSIEDVASVFIAYRNERLHHVEKLIFAQQEYSAATQDGNTSGCLGNTSVLLAMCTGCTYALLNMCIA